MTWLYIPNTPSACAADMGESTSDSVSRWADVVAQFCTVKGKHTRPRYWSLTWKRETWIRLLSGPTSTPSRQGKLLNTWASTLFASCSTVASPVSRGPAPANGGERRTSDGFGPGSGISHKRAVWDGSSWKTSGGLFQVTIPALTSFFGISLARGGMRNGICFPRRNAARRTNASGFSSWPTPRWSEAEKAGPKARDGSGSLHLSAAAMRWPTVTATDSNGRGYTRDRGEKGKEPPSIVGMVNWPTPAARDSKGANGEAHLGKARPHLDQLPNAVLTGLRGREKNSTTPSRPASWSTPREADKNGGKTPMREGTPSLNMQIGQTGPLKLCPEWVEMLMGLPCGWTLASAVCGRNGYRHWETASCRLLRRMVS